MQNLVARTLYAAAQAIDKTVANAKAQAVGTGHAGDLNHPSFAAAFVTLNGIRNALVVAGNSIAEDLEAKGELPADITPLPGKGEVN